MSRQTEWAHRQTDRKTGRQTQADGQTDRQTNRRTDGQTNWRTNERADDEQSDRHTVHVRTRQVYKQTWKGQTGRHIVDIANYLRIHVKDFSVSFVLKKQTR